MQDHNNRGSLSTGILQRYINYDKGSCVDGMFDYIVSELLMSHTRLSHYKFIKHKRINIVTTKR